MKANIDHTWFTADHHFGHTNIIEYADRPFSNVDEMDAILIQRWNMNIGPDDLVFHLGDFTLGTDAQKYFYQLNGKIIVLDNPSHHDRRWLDIYKGLPYGDIVDRGPSFESASEHTVGIDVPLLALYFENIKKTGHTLPIVLCHFPMAEWENSYHGSIHLHGHSHGRHIGKGNIWDVGVDNNDFCPVSLRQVLDRFEIRAT